MKIYYGLVDSENNSWGFLEEGDSRITADMVELTEEQWETLLDEQSQGKQIVYYGGEVFTADSNKYYIDSTGNWQERTDEEINQEKIQQRQEQFEKEFFLTSLGYIRREVSMATGEIKNFLSDLLPTISMGIQLGQEVPIITYKQPDFTQEFTLEYMESLQEIKNVNAQFIQECALQVSKDFLPNLTKIQA